MSSLLPRPVVAALSMVLAAGPLLAHAETEPSPPEAVAIRNTAHVGGLWCGTGPLHSYSLEIAQHAQQIEGKLRRRERVFEITGHVEGSVLRTDPQRDQTLELQAQGNELRVTDGTGILALLRGQVFARAGGATCGT